MIVGVPKEIKNNEFRVGMTPSGVNSFVNNGHKVLVQKNAGLGSGYKDSDYESKTKMLNRATAAKGGRMSFRGGGACKKGMNKNAYGKNS